ncbi:MAG: crossover junction endodeoxyribonuclease RuvC [Candidatus Latescibacterota bacterium]|nr:MAG: crossover junction endodeoxyribonuclease RuvC [Candidatus Latescibacterota bacterium]
MTRVLGIDPGTVRTGFGIVGRDGSRLRRVASGTVELGRAPLPQRLAHLHSELTRLIDNYTPTACAVEGLFQHRNARSALLLGHARGVCLLAAAAHGLDVVELAPATVKRSLTGNGAADKQQVGFMVARLLDDFSESAPDACDALAVAICLIETRKPLRLFG